MRKMHFFNKEKNNSTLNTLANALNNRKQTNINTGGINVSGGVSTTNNNDNTMQGAFQLGKGLTNLYNAGKDNGWFSGSSGDANGIVGSAANDYINGGGGSSSVIGSAISDYGSSGAGQSAISSAIGSEVGSGLASSGSSGGWGGFGGGSGGGMPWGLIAKTAKSGYNLATDKDDSEYSDLEQTMIYPVQGAAIGGSYGGGWGALGGALYGLGYSFKDDVGLKDNDWLTTVLFPIGMGDEHEGIIQL